MTAATVNGGRPLPWQDTPECGAVDETDGRVCHGPMAPVREMPNGFYVPEGVTREACRIACVMCAMARVGTDAEVAQTERANAAYLLMESGRVHPDRGCACCNGPVPLDMARLCSAACVEKDNARRQALLFPEVGRE